MGADGYGEVAAALSVDPMTILSTGLPMQMVRTGLACLIVPMRSLSALRDLLPSEQSLDEILQELGGDCARVLDRVGIRVRRRDVYEVQ